MMLLKCYTQCVSKFGKLSSGHRTGKGHFPFQLLRRSVLKNVQITVQLCSFYMLARLCSKSFKLSFNSTGTENFQKCKLFRKSKGSEIILPIFDGSQRKEGNSI